MTTTTDNLDELIKVCERATQVWRLSGTRHIEAQAFDGSWRRICHQVSGPNPMKADANAQFIATFNPQRCLALLKELKRLQEMTKDFRDLFNLGDQPHE
jgi:hypothetical protein